MKYTKQLFTIIAISLLNINLNAQPPEDVITGLEKSPKLHFTINGNNLYIGDSSGIYKMNINANQPRLKQILPNNHQMLKGSAFSGNFLYTNYKKNTYPYMRKRPEIDNQDKIVKIDTSTDPPTITDFITTGLGNIQDLAINGNTLYIADYGNARIVKADITAQSPSWTKVIDVASGSSISMVVHGNYLYYADYFSVYKVNLTSPNPTEEIIISFKNFAFGNDRSSELYKSTLVLTSSTLALHGNDLYISQVPFSPNSVFNNRILKYDTTRPSQDPVTAFDDIKAYQLNVSGNYLYMLLFDGVNNTKISRINLNPQSRNNQGANNSIKITPNPATNYIRLRGTNSRVSASYTILNLRGVAVKRGLLSNTNMIHVSNLSSGKYVLKINGKAPAMFAKE